MNTLDKISQLNEILGAHLTFMDEDNCYDSLLEIDYVLKQMKEQIIVMNVELEKEAEEIEKMLGKFE